MNLDVIIENLALFTAIGFNISIVKHTAFQSKGDLLIDAVVLALASIMTLVFGIMFQLFFSLPFLSFGISPNLDTPFQKNDEPGVIALYSIAIFNVISYIYLRYLNYYKKKQAARLREVQKKWENVEE